MTIPDAPRIFLLRFRCRGLDIVAKLEKNQLDNYLLATLWQEYTPVGYPLAKVQTPGMTEFLVETVKDDYRIDKDN